MDQNAEIEIRDFYNLFLMNSTHIDIPQFVIIHDRTDNSYKHPIVHYVFEEEDFPQVPKENLIVVELDSTASQLTSVDSYSSNFQVTECVLEQSRLNSQFEKEDSNLFNLTIQGLSVPTDDGSIRDIEHLKEVMAQFEERNEDIFKIFDQQDIDSLTSDAPSSS
ncbi:hypothetical protein BY458DRAFT_23424 [Sporodiniella umbellata]|nr:hypothetical protein BY458DRAFT_23424 [Sporodiniella umbellata]